MSLKGPILVAADLSPSSEEALRQGTTLAAACGTTLAVCHVLPELSQVRVLFPHLAGENEAIREALSTKATQAVIDHVGLVTGKTIDAQAVLIETGSAHVGIRAAAERLGAGLVILGPGATASRVAHHADWAVLVARRDAGDGGVLAATDFSDPSLPAIEAGVSEAARRGVPLRLLHAVDFDFGAAMFAIGPPAYWPASPPEESAIFDGARRDLQEALRRFNAKGETIVARGPAAFSIIQAAASQPTSLLVVGTHGRTGLRRLLLGSVADAVLRGAPCSVLAVPLRTVASATTVA